MSGGGAAFKVFVALHMVDYASSHLMHFSNLLLMAGQNVNAVNNRLKLMGALAAAMVGGVAVGAIVSFGKHAVEAAQNLENVERKVRAIGGITPEVFKGVSSQAWY